uniref:Uncharacterized protein n=1 Tax=Glossina brevipalpis TaxID=37001 RepID=A0A1A9WW76_9MUSC
MKVKVMVKIEALVCISARSSALLLRSDQAVSTRKLNFDSQAVPQLPNKIFAAAKGRFGTISTSRLFITQISQMRYFGGLVMAGYVMTKTYMMLLQRVHLNDLSSAYEFMQKL